MKNELDIAIKDKSLPSEKNNTFTFQQSGEGTNIGLAEHVSQTNINITIPLNNNTSSSQSFIQKPINLEYFNLFVIGGEDFDKPYFMVDVKRALTVTEGTAQDIHNRLAIFDDKAIEEIISYPCIFANENYRYSSPENQDNELQTAQYGFITKIQQLHNGDLKIYYQIMPFCNIPQNVLNSMIKELDILGTPKLNEFDRTHWSIKNVNIVEELKLKGINLFVPSIM